LIARVTLRSTSAERRRRISVTTRRLPAWPFQILHQIGAGAPWPVFARARPASSRFVALKMFRLDLTPEQTEALAAALEALVGDQPRHPGGCRGRGVRRRGPRALAQEYVAGKP
jgi:hypothetical protein